MSKINHADDLETLEKGEPFLRSALAFMVYLRFGNMRDINGCYDRADKFIEQLKEDLK